jgi:hypothetical protein
MKTNKTESGSLAEKIPGRLLTVQNAMVSDTAMRMGTSRCLPVDPVLNQTSRHEDVLGEWRYSPTHSLTSALDGGEWSASRPGRFITGERDAGICKCKCKDIPVPKYDAMKSILHLIKHHVMKTYREWRYSSTRSYPRHYIKVSG